MNYTVKNCCKIYSDLLAILVASKTVNLQKYCKKIQQTLVCCKIVVMVCKHLVNLFNLSPLRRNIS